ncbi:MAG TPA: glycoside hydrolase family 25 protein [Candidatus Saccharimonadales bacterium]
MIKGIDISSMQGTINWESVAASGVEFCIIRCGVGNNGIDSMYTTNIAGAQSVGIKVMAYHFVFPLPTTAAEPTRDPKIQAQMHATAANGVLAACDLEWPVQGDWAKWGCSAPQIVEWVTEYLQAYERITGIKPIVYTFPNFAQCINLPASFAATYQLWIASYENSPYIPSPWNDYVLWQNSGSGKLPNGVTVDTDFAKDLSLWGPATIVAAPVPVLVSDPTPAPASAPAPAPAPVIVSPVPGSSSSIIDTIGSFLTSLFNKLGK